MGFRKQPLVGLQFVLWLVVGHVGGAGELPAFWQPDHAIPSFVQSDPAAGFPNGGRMYCAPVAVSNSLMAMFAEEFQEEDLTQAGLIKLLASDGYMYTDPAKGTRVANHLLRGVQRFVRKRGIEDFSIQFRGLRDHQREFGTGHCKPRLGWIRSNLVDGAAVWLNIGWYRLDEEGKVYQRDDGHWVTAVGYGKDAAGKPDPGTLIVHDPRLAGRLHVEVAPLSEGWIEGASNNYKFPAEGIYQMKAGMPLKKGVDCALLDGVAVLAIRGGS